jgi:hypothetical protein
VARSILTRASKTLLSIAGKMLLNIPIAGDL